MCDVCVAERALWSTRCGRKKCMAYEEGALFAMSEAPRIPSSAHPYFGRIRPWRGQRATRKARFRQTSLHAAPGICVRARGKGRVRAAESAGSYQIKLEWKLWPKEWTRTRDLAGSMGLYGLDVKWRFMPRIVKNWVLGRRKMPTEAEIKASLGLPKEFDSAPRPLKNLMRLSPKKGATRLVAARRPK